MKIPIIIAALFAIVLLLWALWPVSPAPELVPTAVPMTTLPPLPNEPEEDLTAYEFAYQGGAAVLYPRVPLTDMSFRPRRYDIVPGAVFPGLNGLKLEEAVHVVSTTFPMLSVRTVQNGFPLDLEVRKDRLTLIVDPATQYVIDARVG
jgi:hypothetical protein